MSNLRFKFNSIYNENIDSIYRFIYLKVGSMDIAQDLTSETFIRGWEAFKRKEDETINHRAFLYRIARNLVIDHYRDKNIAQTVSIEDLPIIEKGKGLEEKAMISSDMEVIREAMKDLKEDYQDVIIWRYLEELSVSEVADLLGKTEETTRVMTHRALVSLKKSLEGKRSDLGFEEA